MVHARAEVQDKMDAEERALIAEANGRQEPSADAAQAAAAEVDGDEAMDLDDEDPSQMNIVRNYQRQDHRSVPPH